MPAQKTIPQTPKRFLLNQLKILAGALFIAVFFSLVLNGNVFHDGFISMILVTYIQLNIFIWLGIQFFKTIKLTKRQLLLRLILFYLLVLVIGAMFFFAVFFIQNRLLNYGFIDFYDALRNLKMGGFFKASFIGFTFGAVFFFYAQWSEALKREQKLTQEKLLFQYETLKSQVNPHFLFNSLNTLSSLIKSDPVQSEHFVQKLSNIYRYVLENQDKELVPLSAEIKFVQDYFNLQKIRDEEKIGIKIDAKVSENQYVVPVSLQLLVENAIKHNAATRDRPLWVSITNEGQDLLVVRNNLQPKTQVNGSSQTGLNNLNERCKLILGRPIEVVKTEADFLVKLPVSFSLIT